MTEYDNDVIFNGVYLKVKSLSPVKTQKRVKQFMGKSLTETQVLGVSETQWKIDINGVILGTTSANLSTNRASIEGLDTNTAYNYVDGIHNGIYVLIPGSLKIDDKGETDKLFYNYTMAILEQ